MLNHRENQPPPAVQTESAGFDLTYRPASYLDDSAWSLANVKGEWRKRAIKTALNEGDGGSVPEALFGAGLPDPLRAFVGSIHPSMMGGEYLPDLEPGEVEIARISLASTTGDVISIRARTATDVFTYRVVDEYEDDGHGYEVSLKASREPLTMAELCGLIDSTRMTHTDEEVVGLTSFHRDWHVHAAGCEPEEIRHFVRVSSEYYPELEAYYELRADQWLERVKKELEDEQEEEDEEPE